MRVELFGTHYNSPIFLCPTGGEKSFFADGELSVARAAKARGHSAVSVHRDLDSRRRREQGTGPPGVVSAVRTDLLGCLNEKILRRVEAAGCPVIALTVDNTTGRNSETYLRTRRKDLHQCLNCHETPEGPTVKERPMYDGIDMTGVRTQNPSMDWAFARPPPQNLERETLHQGNGHARGRAALRRARRRRHPGIEPRRALHGNLARDDRGAAGSRRGSCGNRFPCSSTAASAAARTCSRPSRSAPKAVGIGRPFLWGLGAFGQAGVDRVLEIMQGELKLVMGNCGTRTVADITREYVETPDWKI